ncbi:MAG: DUF6607 family protein [Pseudomonadota bacterium]
MTQLLSLRRRFAARALAPLAAAAGLAACATGPGAAPTAETFEQDRAAILSMAGDYKVTFDFTETVPFAEGYELKEPKLSGAHEVVRVIEDAGTFISLQHTLVVGGEEKFPVKHWRQDWTYEPDDVLVFIGANAWETRELTDAEARGKWSQEVYQVDDSPRYGAVAAWSHENGLSQWTPPAEIRPLPRRDMTTRDDYDAVLAVNRHAITPFGWVHEQNNSKLVQRTGNPHVLVREIGVNTYKEDSGFEVSVAEDYWTATKDYWAGVRAAWAKVEADAPQFGLTIQGESEALYQSLLGLAQSVADGETQVPEAVSEAEKTIAEFTTTDLASVEDRLAVRVADAQ